MTLKGDGSIARFENEIEISENTYNELVKHITGKLLCKNRYFIPKDKYTIELDIYVDFNDLVLAEVEFANLLDAASFKIPDWFGKDITSNDGFKNKNLSRILGIDKLADYGEYSKYNIIPNPAGIQTPNTRIDAIASQNILTDHYRQYMKPKGVYNMIFEIGKCYRHTTGEEIQIVGEVNTTLYGNCLAAESNRKRDLIPVSKNDEAATVNWTEISQEEWMKNFQ
jgi:hypothetical protein